MTEKEIEVLLNKLYKLPIDDEYQCEIGTEILELKEIKLLLSYIEQLEKQAELGEHYKHLYSEVKKQKDDVVEYIKKSGEIDDNWMAISKRDLLRMLGEIDDSN